MKKQLLASGAFLVLLLFFAEALTAVEGPETMEKFDPKAVRLYEGFEKSSPTIHLYNPKGYIQNTDPKYIAFGKASLRADNPKGEHDSMANSSWWPPGWLHEGHDGAYLRAYYYFPKGFQIRPCDELKLFGISAWQPGLRDTPGSAGTAPDGTDGFAFRIVIDTDDTLQFYYYHPEQKRGYGDHVDISYRIERGKFFCLETQIQANTVMEATPLLLAQRPDLRQFVRGDYVVLRDGLLRCWVNGKLIDEITGIRFRDIPELKIRRYKLGPYWGGAGPRDTSPKDQEFYWDELVVSSSYIGPLEQVGIRPQRREKKPSGPSVWDLIAEKQAELRQSRKPLDPLADFAELLAEARGIAIENPDKALRLVKEAVGKTEDLAAKNALGEVASGFAVTAELKKWIMEGASPERSANAFVRIFGTPSRCKVVGADENGITAAIAGITMQLPWKDIQAKTFHEMAGRYAMPEGKELSSKRMKKLYLFGIAHDLIKIE